MGRWVTYLLFLFSPIFTIEALIIGIAGPSGAGKTTLAQKLAEGLSEDALVISQDSYYHDFSHLTLKERDQKNFDHPDSIDFELMREHLIRLKEEENISQPIYDFKTHSRTDKYRILQPKKILIVEGCLLLAVPKICDLLDIKLFIDADLDICLARRIERDQKERERSFNQIQAQYFSTVRPMFFKFIAPSKYSADMIILSHHENRVVLNFIASKLSYEVSMPSTISNGIKGSQHEIQNPSPF